MGEPMADVVKLNDYKVHCLERDGFALWRSKYAGPFNVRTRLQDLPAATLSRLAEPGDQSAAALCGMIIGFLGYGQAPMDALDPPVQGHVVDIHFFIADLIRFEIMSRLGWLEQFSGNAFSLFDMVRRYEEAKIAFQGAPPRLSKDYPDFPAYQKMIERDQQVFIRRILPAALHAFKLKHGL